MICQTNNSINACLLSPWIHILYCVFAPNVMILIFINNFITMEMIIHLYFLFFLLVYQALCLEQLSAHELLVKVTSKLGLTPAEVSSFVRVTLTGIMVLVDDTVSER